MNLFHLVTNVSALIPLLDRFEHDYGTLTTLALFFGRTSTPYSFSQVYKALALLAKSTSSSY